jgi:hypothetical protein
MCAAVDAKPDERAQPACCVPRVSRVSATARGDGPAMCDEPGPASAGLARLSLAPRFASMSRAVFDRRGIESARSGSASNITPTSHGVREALAEDNAARGAGCLRGRLAALRAGRGRALAGVALGPSTGSANCRGSEQCRPLRHRRQRSRPARCQPPPTASSRTANETPDYDRLGSFAGGRNRPRPEAILVG